MQNQQNLSYRVALGGIVSSFCLMSMFLTGVFPLLYLVLPMIAGVLLLIVVMEVGIEWAWVTYTAVGLLSLFVTYDKEASLIFILFFGCYPLITHYLKRIQSRTAQTLLKLALFNISMIIYFYLNTYLFGMQELLEELARYGRHAGKVMLILLNPFFLMYDSSLGGLCELYTRMLKPRITGRKV